MKNCLIILNKNAGKCDRCNLDEVENAIGTDRNFTRTDLSSALPDLSKFDEIAVCGGDGTLSSVMQKLYEIEKSVYYFPCGTLNDKGKTKTNNAGNPVLGKVGNKIFTYVFATGTFTPIGYAVDQRKKKRLGVLAYILDIVSEYKVNFDSAKITCDNETYEGDFTLIMFIKSPRCFGFRFNRDYDENSESGHLVAIRSPRHDGLAGKIEIFFPFFRVFFIGLKKERNGKIIFKRFSKGSIEIKNKTQFCVDGELYVTGGKQAVSFDKAKCTLTVKKVKCNDSPSKLQ